MEFDLLVNEKLVSTFHNDKKIRIPKKDKFSFQETAEVNIFEAGKTIFYAMVKKNAVYSIIGKYFIDSSFGTFTFKVKLIEKELNESLKSSHDNSSK